MPRDGDAWQEVLTGYDNFLREKDLAPPPQRPHLVRWVREFLTFAQAHPGFTFEQTLDLFLSEIGNRLGSKPWQIQQAADAVRIYRYQYRAASAGPREDGPAPELLDDAARLTRLREAMRLRHYARRTEKTYLQWTRRFLNYRRDTHCEGEPTCEEVKAFLTRLAMVERVSASTQNQAFSAVLLFFREVLRTDLEEMSQTVRARRGRRLPTVLSVGEVQALLAAVVQAARVPNASRHLPSALYRPTRRPASAADRPRLPRRRSDRPLPFWGVHPVTAAKVATRRPKLGLFSALAAQKTRPATLGGGVV